MSWCYSAIPASIDTTTAIGTGSFFFSSRRRHTRLQGDWSSDVCSSDLTVLHELEGVVAVHVLDREHVLEHPLQSEVGALGALAVRLEQGLERQCLDVEERSEERR